MVAAAGGAPAVTTRRPLGAFDRTSAGALATPMSTVGAAQRMDTDSASIASNTFTASPLRRQMCAAPTAVTLQTNVHPFAWNIGRVHRYLSLICIGTWRSVPITFRYALRCVIITPLGRDVVPLV